MDHPSAQEKPVTFRPDSPRELGGFVPTSELARPVDQKEFRLLSPFNLVRQPPVALPLRDDPDPALKEQLPEIEEVADVVPPPPQVLIPRPTMVPAEDVVLARAVALAEGRRAGQAEAEARLQAERADVQNLVSALAQAVAQLAAPPTSTVEALTRSLDTAVARLASERAGQAIDLQPGPFATRIARLADRLAQGMREVSIHLNPADVQALQTFLTGAGAPELASLAAARLVPDSRLSRGDADLHAPGLRLADLIDAASLAGSSVQGGS